MTKTPIFFPVLFSKRKPIISQCYFTYWDVDGTPQGLGAREYDAEKELFDEEDGYTAQPDYWLEDQKEGIADYEIEVNNLKAFIEQEIRTKPKELYYAYKRVLEYINKWFLPSPGGI